MVTSTSQVQVQDPAACLYEQVADRISRLIESGTLRPGDRIPSVRKLRNQQAVSISTVTEAYRLLENRGLIEARPQSGYYVRHQRWSLPPEPEMTRPQAGASRVEVGDLGMRVLRATQDPELVRFGAALPAPELFPTRELHRAAATAARRAPVLANSYDASPGLKVLRTQVAKRAIDSGCTLSPDDIVITTGATEALSLCLRAVARPGDTIAIESPTFFGLLNIIESLGLRACEIPTFPKHGICLNELQSRLDACEIKACLFCTNFSNPLGSCMPDEKKRSLVELLATREIPLIEDNLYGALYFGPQQPKTAKAFDRQGLVLLCDSFTKTLAPGYRIGWTAPGRFKARVDFLKSVSTSATASLTQLAIAEFLAYGGYDHHLRKIRRNYQALMERMADAVGRYFPAGTRVSRPSGGHVLWVELPQNLPALELFEHAMAEKISIAPGPMFSPTQKYQNCLRLNCANPWSDRIEQALKRLGELANQLRPAAEGN